MDRRGNGSHSAHLKKVLALVMAFAMAFTMMAGAAFTDSADIEATEAVDTLSALGVINGYEDGSFKPNGTVTRAEMAAMIYIVRNGGKTDASGYENLPTSFTDIKGHWAEGFIKHAQTMGIISGRSDKIFDPNAKVTGVEAALMCLRTAGYDAAKAGIGGTTWANKTLSLANEKGLLDDVKADLNAACPRQWAAQLIYNLLDAEWVVWSNDINDFKAGKTTTSIVDNTVVSKSETVGTKYLGLTTVEDGILLAVEKEDNKDTFRVTTTKDTYTKVEKDYSDLMGQTVKVMIKDGEKDKVYGIHADEDSKVLATGSVGVIDSVSSDKIKLDGVEYKKETSLTSAVKFNTAETVALATLAANKDTTPAWDIKVIDNNDNGKADKIVVTPKDVEKVTYVGKTSVTAGKSYKLEDATVYEGIAKDDFAVIVADKYSVDGNTNLTKADTVEGKVEGVKGTDPVKVMVDGTWYTLVNKAQKPSNDDTVKLAVVGSYAYDCDATAGASKDILFLSGAKPAENDLNTDYTAEARAYFVDGTNKKIVVDKLDGNDLTNDQQLTSDVLYTYKTDGDGNYELTTVKNEEGKRAGYDKYTTASFTSSSNTIDSKKFADDAVVFVKANKEIKVITGKTVRDWSSVSATNKGALIGETNSISYVKVAALTVSNDKVPGATGDYLYGYVTGDAYETTQDGDTVYKFNIWDGSADKTLVSKDSVTVEAGVAVEYRADGEFVKDVVPLTADAIIGSNRALDDDIQLAINDEATTIDKDATVIAMDDKEKEGVEGGVESLQEAQEDTDGSYINNAYVKVEDGKVLAIVYDAVNNELDEVITASDVAEVIKEGIDSVDAMGTNVEVKINSNHEFTVDVTGDAKSASEINGVKVENDKTVADTFTTGADYFNDDVKFSVVSIELPVKKSATYKVVQTNPAFADMYTEEQLTADPLFKKGNDGVWTKTKDNYEASADNAQFAIPLTTGTATVVVTVNNVDYTFTINANLTAK